MDFVKKTLNNVFGGVPSSPPPSSSSSIHASSNLSSSPNPSLKLSNVPMSGSSSLHSSPSSTNSNNFMYGGQPEDAHSLSNFKSSTTSYHHFTGAFLNFEKNDDYGNGTTWQESLHVQGYDQLHPKYASSNSRLSQEFNSGQSSSSYRSTMVIDTINEINPNGDQDFSLEANDATTRGEMCANKRPCKEESTQGLKRHCTTKVKQQQQQPKPKSNPAKDPQSVAAKNRRERISEKLKTLQELVPNGSKVDLVTMLDKAITYVKFLQLQMKVLATDEFWPAQSGKAPELSQVQEAIDAILSSSKHRNNNSSAS